MCDYTDVRIMVVESDPDQLKHICDALLVAGVQGSNIVCCDSLQAAKAYIADGLPINLILIEAQSKDANGYSICSLMDATKDKRIPVIVTTYIADIGPFYDVITRAQGFIHKPVNVLALDSTMKKYIRGQRLEAKYQALLEKGCPAEGCPNA